MCCERDPRTLVADIFCLMERSIINSSAAIPNFLLDVRLVCGDGFLMWNSFLLAAYSSLLRGVLEIVQRASEEECVVLVLPEDVTSSSVVDLLRCTIDPTMTTESVSDKQMNVMKLLGIEISTDPSLSVESFGCDIDNESLDNISLLSGSLAMSPTIRDCLVVADENDYDNDKLSNSPKAPGCDVFERYLDNRESVDPSASKNIQETEQADQVQIHRHRVSVAEGGGGGRRRYPCMCGLEFDRRLHYGSHSVQHDCTRLEYLCVKCGKKFYHPDNLHLHERYHRDREIARKCTECEVRCFGRHSLKAHFEKYHAEDGQCTVCAYCTKRLSTQRQLKKHVKKFQQKEIIKGVVEEGKEKRRSFYCHLCGRGFTSAHSLVIHKKVHGNNEENTDSRTLKKMDGGEEGKEEYIRCDLCRKLFASGKHWSLHVKRTHDLTPEKCETCGKMVKDLTQHVRRHHKFGDAIIASAIGAAAVEADTVAVDVYDDTETADERKRMECVKCHRTFSSIYSLKNHSYRVHGQNDSQISLPHKCDVCGKRFVALSLLRRHIRETHGENRFECYDCGHLFPVRHSLERHIKFVHHSIKMECPYCATSLMHLAPHLVTTHQMDPLQARNLAEHIGGKSSARTHLTLETILHRRILKANSNNL